MSALDRARASGPNGLRDPARLAAVRATGLARPEADAGLDAIASLTAQTLRVPAATVSLLDGDAELLAGAFGLPTRWLKERSLPLSHSLGPHAIANGDLLIVDDASSDPALKQSAAVESFGARAYAGVPLKTGDGYTIGVLAAFDSAPREWSDSEVDRLRDFAKLTIADVERRRELHESLLEQRALIEAREATERENGQLEADARALDVLLDVSRTLASQPDARTGVCEAASELGDASLAVLWEPTRDGTELTVTAEYGAAIAPLSVPLRSGVCAETDTFLNGSNGAAANGEPNLSVNERLVTRSDAISFALQRVSVEDRPLGVLELGWQRGSDQIPSNAETLMALLAVDAAGAIDRARRTAKLVAEARTDPLTGLPNRRAWTEELARDRARARRLGHPLSVVMADLDHFKEVNDQQGHAAGDRLLKALAVSWRRELRDIDLLARIGGEEFTVILPNCDADEAAAVCERLRQTTPDGVTASLGIAAWDHEEPDDELLARADRALYTAKRQRNHTALA
jgi:diguanylate cyclase (GGDEF)-like protein